MELSCILEGSALGKKGLMHVLHMNMYVSCILEGSALGRIGFMSVLSMDMCVNLLSACASWLFRCRWWLVFNSVFFCLPPFFQMMTWPDPILE